MSLMRGRQPSQSSFTAFYSIEQMVEAKLDPKHPLRAIKKHTDQILKDMSPEFDKYYAPTGRDSVAPELLLRALLWQVLYSIRSEILLVEQIQFDIRCRWFVGLPLDHDAWDHSTFTANRKNLRLDMLAEAFFKKQVEYLRGLGLVSNEHFTVDGTLLEAWASQKSMVEKSSLDKDGKPPAPPKGGRNAPQDFRGTKRSNETHVSATDMDARIARKNGTSVVAHLLSVIMENRNGFAVDGHVTEAMSTAAERRAALLQLDRMLNNGWNVKTLGADKGYAEDAFILDVLDRGVEPHLPARADRPDALARQLTCFEGHRVSQKIRMFIETIFGYIKSTAGAWQVKVRGHIRVQGRSYMLLSGMNMRRLATICP